MPDPVGCICVTHYNERGFGVIPEILAECPYHRGVHPLTRLAGITCPDCGATSYSPEDVRQGYCGKCHWWTSDPILGKLRDEDDISHGEAMDYGQRIAKIILEKPDD